MAGEPSCRQLRYDEPNPTSRRGRLENLGGGRLLFQRHARLDDQPFVRRTT
jgi:hypothetical protein